MPTKNSAPTAAADRPDVTPANTKEAWERAIRGWGQAAKLHSEALQKGELTIVEEAEERLLHVASAFLLGHGKGDATLPRPVATWLHGVLEDARSGFAIPGLRQRASGRAPGEMGEYARQTAVAYVQAAREGLIEDADPVDSVARCYGVDSGNVYRWVARYRPHEGLVLLLRERAWSLAERSAWAKRALTMHGTNYKVKNSKRR